MMIESLAERLRKVDPNLSAEELADVLWIARLMEDPADTPSENVQEPRPGGNVKATESGLGSVTENGQVTEPFAGSGRQRSPHHETHGTQWRLYVPENGTPGNDVTAAPVRSPTLPALAHTLEIARALRPLRLTMPSRLPGRVDEERTARRFADTLIWDPQLEPVTESLFDLMLVVDVAPSMAVWRDTADELRVLLERLGAFRDVRMRLIDTNAAELPDVMDGTSGGRRIVLVLSDCIGAAWTDGRAAALLERWGSSAVIAIVQPLPQRLWRGCQAAMERVWLSAPDVGAPNASLSVRMRDRYTDVPPGIVIPVLELERRWLEPWAAMVAGSGAQIPGIALFTGRPTPAPPPTPQTTPQGLTGLERVLRFRATASPKAVELAGYLAAAPLRLPVMRLVQGTMMPGSTPAHLAEVFLGGLLRLESEGRDVAYEFHDGVRDELLSGLRRDDALLVLRQVWGTVRDRVGSSLDFTALLTAVEEDPAVLPPNQPFAQVAADVLARMGGRYSEVAQQLKSREPLPQPNVSERNGHIRAPQVIRAGLPPRNRNFHGRSELLSRVGDSLQSGGVTVLLGDKGKTEIALEVVHTQLDEYAVVFWIQVTDLRSVRASLYSLARRLGTPMSDDLSVTIRNLLQALEIGLPGGGRWLLVYDDACDLNDLFPLMPGATDAGDVLVTSRDRMWERMPDAAIIKVGPFTRAESISMLETRVPGVRLADALAEALGEHPGALAQAANQLAENSDADEYLRLFNERMSGSCSDRYAAALGITLDRLRDGHPEANQLLELCAFHALTCRAQDTLDSALRTLARLELIRFDPDTRTMWTSRSARDILRKTIPADAAARARERTHALLFTGTPATHRPEDKSSWPMRALITPHLTPSEIVSADTVDARAVVVDQARFLYHFGDYEGCRALAEEAVTRWRARFGNDDSSMLDAAQVLTSALYSRGRPKETAEAMSLAEEILRGMNGPTVLTAGRLGGGQGLRYHGDPAAAHELDDAVWRATDQRYGPDHPETLKAAEKVATDLFLMGRFHEALIMDERLRAPFGRARDLHALGRYTEALRLYKNDSELQALGRDHAHVLREQRAQAGTLRKAGRLTDAARLAKEALDGHLRRFGVDHPTTLAAQVTAALADAAAGAPGPGRVLAEEALKGYRRTLGDGHPFTSACMIDLAIILRAVGDIRGAVELDRGVLGGLGDYFGLCGAAGMGNDLYLLGELRAAHSLVGRAAEGFRVRLGPRHPYAVACQHNLGLIGRALGARPAPVVETLAALLGEDHPEVRAAARDELLDCDIEIPSL